MLAGGELPFLLFNDYSSSLRLFILQTRREMVKEDESSKTDPKSKLKAKQESQVGSVSLQITMEPAD